MVNHHELNHHLGELFSNYLNCPNNIGGAIRVAQGGMMDFPTK